MTGKANIEACVKAHREYKGEMPKDKPDLRTWLLKIDDEHGEFGGNLEEKM